MSNSSTTTNTNTVGVNGKAPKKNLADQLDRLDRVIDDLSVGLNETVAHIVQQAVTVAVKQAIEGVVQALLNNPELLRTLAAQVVPPAATPTTPAPTPAPEAKGPSLLKRVATWTGNKVRSVWKGIKEVAQRKGRKVKAGLCSIGLAVKQRSIRAWQFTRRLAQWTWEGKRTVGLALCVGAVVGTASFYAGPIPASVVCGLSVVGLTLAARVLLPLWRLMDAVPSGSA
jgi:hypothetical protein